jgi:hypothetical protein
VPGAALVARVEEGKERPEPEAEGEQKERRTCWRESRASSDGS